MGTVRWEILFDVIHTHFHTTYKLANSLVKMFNDMDFLSQVTPLVDALGVNPSTMRRNPFALPHNLDQSTPPSKAKARQTGDGEKDDERGDAGDEKEEDDERDEALDREGD